MKKYLLIILVYFFSLSFNSFGNKDNTSDKTINENSIFSDNGTTFVVKVNSSKFYIDGIQTKSLFMKKGYTYFFDSSDASTGSHPLFIGTTSSGGIYTFEYTSGITNSRKTNGTLTFIVPSDSPSTLYYNCGNHSSMGGLITIN